jgi:hypothetical protein
LSLRTPLLWLPVACTFLIVSALAAPGCASAKATAGDGGKLDGALDADEDATADDAGGGGPDDSPVYPEAPSLRAPDGCFLSGAVCLDGTTCCSAYCVEGGCQIPPKQM